MTPLPRSFGTLAGGHTYLAIGSGSPLVVIPGLLPTHDPLTGRARQAQAEQLKAFAATRRVWWVNRAPGQEPGTTIEQIAASYADALLRKFGAPVNVLGTSTGGSIALQLAADHPNVVKRLVVASAAHRLSPLGRRAQAEAADRLEVADPRGAALALVPLLATTPAGQRMLRLLASIVGASVFTKADADLVTTLRAENGFTLADRLGAIQAPTLVIGGSNDPLYSEELFRETAERIPLGQLDLVPGAGHIRAQAGRGFEKRVLAFLDATSEELAADLAVSRATAYAEGRDTSGAAAPKSDQGADTADTARTPDTPDNSDHPNRADSGYQD